MKFSLADKYMLCGGGDLLCSTADYLMSKNIDFIVATSRRHFIEPLLCRKNLSLRDYLDKHGVLYSISDDINQDNKILDFVTDKTMAISFGAAWKFDRSFIDKFNGNFVNLHGSRLPLDRGGGGYSWRILRKDRIGINSVHLVTPNYDTGDIVEYEDYIFSKNCRLPIDYHVEGVQRYTEFVIRFIESVQRGKVFREFGQPEYLSSYWPRLYTEDHGYIDWRDDVDDIESLICAFDDPYCGASTFINSNLVRLKKAYSTYADGTYHPFQYGLIYRVSDEYVFVAANNGSLIISEVMNDNGENIIQKMRVGDRFFTPSNYLDSALARRAIYEPNGIKNIR